MSSVVRVVGYAVLGLRVSGCELRETCCRFHVTGQVVQKVGYQSRGSRLQASNLGFIFSLNINGEGKSPAPEEKGFFK